MCNKTGIKRGNYFTVVEWYNTNDKSYIGDIFKVLSIAGTLIQAQRQHSLKDLHVLDTNIVKIVKVSGYFAKRVINKDTSECCKCCCNCSCKEG